ncbi:hypothetical protein BH10PSE8_BH10PSE8_15060 [soil metagenome]
MSRTRTYRLGLLLAALIAPVASVEAAGPGIGSFASAPKATLMPVSCVQQRLSRSHWTRQDGGTRQHRWTRQDGPRHQGGRHWSRDRRGVFTSAGYLGPWASSTGATSSHALSSDGDGPQRWVDRNAFETMPVRMGIARAPTPEPTLYRIEGRRDRPATRVIRISDPEPPQGRRSRFAHAETGALLLTVPRR